MALTTAMPVRQERRGLRPADPARDLGSIARLIEETFAAELDARGRAILRDMRRMARLWPWLGWLAATDPAMQEAIHGFVWEEPLAQGGRPQIVGNVSLNRAPGNRQRWILCNVAVRAEFRRQGIARQLTQAAIEEAEELGGEGLILQVFEANTAARRLYAELGFREVGGQAELRLEAIPPWRSGAGGRMTRFDAPGYEVRGWHSRDGRAAYELASRVTPAEQQWLSPLRPGDYGLSGWQRLEGWLGDLAAGRRTHRLTAWQGGRLAAMLKVTEAGRGGGHHLGLLVDPEHAGRVEAALISQALSVLEEAPPRPVWATVDNRATAALEALRRFGFQEKRTLLTLTRDLR